VPVEQQPWGVPYLPIDPHDVGRSYEAVIRVNSQSGKGGVAYVLKNEHHLDLPRRMQIEFSRVVQEVADDAGGEISPARIWELYGSTYLRHDAPLQLLSFTSDSGDRDRIRAEVVWQGAPGASPGEGNGPIAAFVHALSELDLDVRVLDYSEHATGAGEEAQAASYLEVAVDGRVLWGFGLHPSIVTASLRGIVSAVNRASG
jgi:2-isopropylmalate synthase